MTSHVPQSAVVPDLSRVQHGHLPTRRKVMCWMGSGGVVVAPTTVANLGEVYEDGQHTKKLETLLQRREVRRRAEEEEEHQPEPEQWASPLRRRRKKETIDPQYAKEATAAVTIINSNAKGFLMRSGELVTCYFCGEGVPVDAIHTHMAECEVELARDLAYLYRHPMCGLLAMPDRPDIALPDNIAESSPEERVKYSIAALNVFKTITVPCRGCGGKFSPGVVLDHFSACQRSLTTVEGSPLRIRGPSVDSEHMDF